MRKHIMKTHLLTGGALLALLAASSPAFAQTGPARVAFPVNYATEFVLYNVVDRIDGKHARFMYINPAAAAAAKPGEPLPDGTIVVMELREVEQDATGQIVFDEKGRMKPLAKVRGVFLQEKRKGWGEAIAADKRNGDWDYAAYLPDGRPNPQVTSQDGCFTCHLARKDRDYTFTTFRNVQEGIPRSR